MCTTITNNDSCGGTSFNSEKFVIVSSEKNLYFFPKNIVSAQDSMKILCAHKQRIYSAKSNRFVFSEKAETEYTPIHKGDGAILFSIAFQFYSSLSPFFFAFVLEENVFDTVLLGESLFGT